MIVQHLIKLINLKVTNTIIKIFILENINKKGFIAQDVINIIPNACFTDTDYIPDELRIIENPKWFNDNQGNNILTTDDIELNSTHTGNCKFYVSNDQSGNDEIMQDIKINTDKITFNFEKNGIMSLPYGVKK